MSSVFKTFFEIGSAVSLSMLVFLVLPAIFIHRKLSRK